ncbi:MAG: glutamate--tRNA ligase [Burkholderiales bacterium]|nr:glutamate--tRNA ligase [Burkholderiales bacterium]
MTFPLKSRFAPSPTGLIHFGNVRTALFNALLSRKFGGTFLLRIEDTDAARSREEYTLALQEDLRWLGLLWQEGDGVGGDLGPYRQSGRVSIYEEHLKTLEAQDRVYPCFCSAIELEVSRKIQAQSGQPPRYGGKCAHLKPDEIENKKNQGLPYTLRFRMPKKESVEFFDLVRGRQSFPTDEIGDFIIRRSDGTFAFFYVNALDDALMQVTHVLRGEDHLTNTPRQIAILNAFGLPIPQYGHISLIVDGMGAPLSKRSGSLSVQELREIGYFPIAVDNYLARLGHNYAENSLMDLDALAASFSPDNLGRAPARYDRTQLDHWQALALQKTDAAIIAQWIAPQVSSWVPEADLMNFTEAVRDNLLFPHDARIWAEAVYSATLPLSPDAIAMIEETPVDFFREASTLLTPELDFKAFAQRVREKTGAQGKKLFMPLRAALTGQTHGPEMPRVLPLIGYERARHRLLAHVLNEDID